MFVVENSKVTIILKMKDYPFPSKASQEVWRRPFQVRTFSKI